MSVRTALILAGAVLCGSPAAAATLTGETCPFAGDAVPETHTTRCFRSGWADQGVAFRSSVAVFDPVDPEERALPVIYLPGGPGDAPVDDEARPESILRLFPNRTVITMNPRGVENTSPRPVCRFGPDYWIEDIPFEREKAMTAGCRDAVDRQNVPLKLYDPRRIAADIDALAAALGLREAGIMSVSYGTEIALHLLVQRPNWLRLAILDSVSLPGVVGLSDQLRARDSFLSLIERLCFIEEQCPADLRYRTRTLTKWTAEFDAAPVRFSLGPDNAVWELDGGEMLDVLAGLATYPDGAAYAVELMAVFEAARSDAEDFVAGEVQSNLEFGKKNYALLLETYSDGVAQADRAALDQPVRYPYDREEWSRFLDIYAVWNTSGRREEPFVGTATTPRPVGLPVLVLSGGVDSATPIAWAKRLHRRFSGLTHYIFPYLGHATAFGQEGEVRDPETIAQMACAPKVIAAFLRGRTPPSPCDGYRHE